MSAIYAKKEKHSESLEALYEACHLDSSRTKEIVKVADLLWEHHQWKAAKEAYNLALKAYPQNDEIKNKIKEMEKEISK